MLPLAQVPRSAPVAILPKECTFDKVLFLTANSFRGLTNDFFFKILSTSFSSQFYFSSFFLEVQFRPKFSILPLPFITLHYPSLPFITLHYPALPYITLHYPALPCITLHYPTLPCITLHYPSLPFITLHYPELPCITLHYPASNFVRGLLTD